MALPGDFSRVMALWLTFFGITVMIITDTNFTCYPHMIIKFNIFEGKKSNEKFFCVFSVLVSGHQDVLEGPASVLFWNLPK